MVRIGMIECIYLFFFASSVSHAIKFFCHCDKPCYTAAWMHYLGDYAPHNTEMYEAKYKLPTDSEGTNKTGTPRQYFNKGPLLPTLFFSGHLY